MTFVCNNLSLVINLSVRHCHGNRKEYISPCIIQFISCPSEHIPELTWPSLFVSCHAQSCDVVRMAMLPIAHLNPSNNSFPLLKKGRGQRNIPPHKRTPLLPYKQFQSLFTLQWVVFSRLHTSLIPRSILSPTSFPGQFEAPGPFEAPPPSQVHLRPHHIPRSI